MPEGPPLVQPVAVSQVDRAVREAVAEAVPGAQPTMARDARLAVHKATNVMMLMVTALVLEARQAALADAAVAEATYGKRKGRPAGTMTVAEAQRRLKAPVTGREVELALEAAGMGHYSDLIERKRDR